MTAIPGLPAIGRSGARPPSRPAVRGGRLLLVVLVALVGIAWAALWAWSTSPAARYLDHRDLDADGLSPLTIALFVAGWLLMTVAMMLPTSLPLLATFRAVVGRRPHPDRLALLVVGGYVATWTAVGLALFVMDLGVHAAVDAIPWLSAHPNVVVALTLLAAGAYQFTPAQVPLPRGVPLAAHVRHGPLACRPAGPGGVRDRDPPRRVLRRRCWSVMLVLFSLGMGNLAWMLGAGVVMAVEKNRPGGRRLGRPGRRAAACRRHDPGELTGRTADGRRYPHRVSRAWRAANGSDGAAPGSPAIVTGAGTTEPSADGIEARPRDAPAAILAAARACLLEDGDARLSTRRVADAAAVPLSQIHYHFGSKRQLVLRILAAENERLLERQAEMYAGPQPLWRQWEQACDYLDEDLRSGYVRVLQEMVAASWSDPALASAVRELVGGWFRLLTDVARRVEQDGVESWPVHRAGGRGADGPPVRGRRADAPAGLRRGRDAHPERPAQGRRPASGRRAARDAGR